MRPESILVGIYTFNSRLGTRITAYKSGSRLSSCAARSNRDIIDSKGLSSLISLISSTSAVDIDRLQQSDHLEIEGGISFREMLTHAICARNRNANPVVKNPFRR